MTKGRPVDLWVALGVSVASVLVVLGLPWAVPLRILLGAPLLLVIPGYVLVGTLFPAAPPSPEMTATRAPAGSLGTLERFALSLGLSLAVVPLLGLLLNVTPLGIRTTPVLLTVATFNVLFGLLAWMRRQRIPEPLRPSFVLRFPRPAAPGSAVGKLLAILIVAAALSALAAVAYVALAPRSAEPFTEFYVLGPEGKAEGYPTRLAAGETGHVILGIANHETGHRAYTVTPTLVNVTFAANATGVVVPTEHGRTPLPPIRVDLDAGALREVPFDFTLPTGGPTELLLELRDGVGEGAYRSLHLWINAPEATP